MRIMCVYACALMCTCVCSGILIMPSFKRDFCQTLVMEGLDKCYQGSLEDTATSWNTFTTLFNVLFYVGAVIGAFLASNICETNGQSSRKHDAMLHFLHKLVYPLFSINPLIQLLPMRLRIEYSLTYAISFDS